MEYTPHEVDTFAADWFQFETYPLEGNLHTIYKDGVNPPHIFYEKGFEVGQYHEYSSMAVISSETGEVLYNGYILTDEERSLLSQFVRGNKDILLEYWETYCTDKICEKMKI